MKFVIQMIFFVAICAAVFPGSSAVPVDDEEEKGNQETNLQAPKVALNVFCTYKTTPVTSYGANNGELIYLDRHFVSCGPYEFLNNFRFVRSGVSDAYYRYNCCYYH